MPTYDYRCPDCQHRFGVFMSYAEYGQKKVACPNCGNARAQRVIGRIRIVKSDDRRLEDMSDPASFLGDVDENDPRSIGRAMKKMGQQMGEDLPPEFSEITERLEAGENPESIEKSMPELGGEGSGGVED
jgi:putative FmdB family regulatory protein